MVCIPYSVLPGLFLKWQYRLGLGQCVTSHTNHLQMFHCYTTQRTARWTFGSNACYIRLRNGDTDHIYNNMAINRAGAFMKNCLKWNIMSYASAWAMLCYKTVLRVAVQEETAVGPPLVHVIHTELLFHHTLLVTTDNCHVEVTQILLCQCWPRFSLLPSSLIDL